MRRFLVLAAVLLAGGLAVAVPACAAAPVKDGWWSQTNVGLGFSVIPAQVPNGGLYVQNGFNGPTAISALVVDVPSGAAVGRLTLVVTGQPVITSPPVACPLTASGAGFKPAQGGPWSDRPAYDCGAGEVKAAVAANHATVSFDAGRLLSGGTVAVAILAGGPGDQIAFDRPGPGTLAVTSPVAAPSGGSASVPSGAAAGPPAPGPAAPGSQVAAGPGGPASPSSAPAAPTAPAPAPEGVAVAAPAAGPVTSPLAQPEPAGAGAAGGAPRPAPAPASRSGSSGGGRAAEIVGLIGLIGLLVAYTEGYGLLGGRIRGQGPAQAGRRRPA